MSMLRVLSRKGDDRIVWDAVQNDLPGLLAKLILLLGSAPSP